MAYTGNRRQATFGCRDCKLTLDCGRPHRGERCGRPRIRTVELNVTRNSTSKATT